jgi:pimeloyl-ACP methyl ester carboxylesterase
MTYLLIHGGGSTARFWDLVAPLLAGPTLAVDLPGRGRHPADLATVSVEDEVASVLADVTDGAVDDPIVIVAHSSGGLVVPGVTVGLGDRVERIVLSAALVPAEGERGVDCMKPAHRDGLITTVAAAAEDGTVITLPGAPADPESFRHVYGGDPLTDEQLAFMTSPQRCVPDTVHHYFQPIHWSRAAGVPVRYLLNERDRPVQPHMQDTMIGHLPGPVEVVRLDCGHLPAVTDPIGFADLVG